MTNLICKKKYEKKKRYWNTDKSKYLDWSEGFRFHWINYTFDSYSNIGLRRRYSFSNSLSPSIPLTVGWLGLRVNVSINLHWN